MRRFVHSKALCPFNSVFFIRRRLMITCEGRDMRDGWMEEGGTQPTPARRVSALGMCVNATETLE